MIGCKVYLGLPTTPVEKLTNGGFETAGAGGADVFGTWTETASETELTLNLGFETAGGGGADVFGSWTETTLGTGTVTDETSEKHAGSHSAKVTGDGTVNNYGRVRQAVTVEVGEDYRISFWVKGAYSAGIWFHDIQGEIVHGNAADWTQITRYYTAQYTDFQFSLVSNIQGVSGTAYYDDVSIIKDYGTVEDTASSHGGSHAALMEGTGSLEQAGAVTAEAKLSLSFWSKGDGTDGLDYTIYDVTNAATVYQGAAPISTDWQKTTYVFYAPVGCASIKVTFTGEYDQGPFYLDDVSLLQYGAIAFEETTDVLASPNPTWEYGIAGSGPMNLLAGTGTASFVLDNQDGSYSPEGGSRVVGFEEGMPVKITLSIDVVVPDDTNLLLNGGFEDLV